MSYLYQLAQISTSSISNIKPIWVLAQWAHETGGFQSELCINYNNYAGLTQYEQNECPQPDGDMYYMTFFTAKDFAEYFGIYLSYYRSDGIYQCTTLEEYIACLKRGGYFGDSYENYLEGVKRWLAIIQ